MEWSGDRRGRSALILIAGAFLVAACASVATRVSEDEDGKADATERVERDEQEEVEPPPFVPPEEMAEEQWSMPDIDTHEAVFPYLPEESSDASRSIGNVTHGWLVGGRLIPQPHPYLKALDEQYERGLMYTSDAMLELIEAAGEHVVEEYPDSPVPLGNFSARGGGDIPYSVSHNSGRDGDIGFFAHDAEGEPVELPGLLPFDEGGVYEGEEGEFYFDAERNWKFVEGLIEASEGDLQYIFISRPLKEMLLAEARRQKASPKTVARARELLRQPGGALPHNDHFHIRIYCTEVDVRSGCENSGRRVTGFESHERARRETIGRAVEALADERTEMRKNAARRLALLEADSRARAVAELLDDDEPTVRAAAARALTSLERGSTALADRLGEEDDPQVIAEIIGALGRIGDGDAMQALVGELAEPRPLELAGEVETDARALAAGALVDLERSEPVAPLIDVLDSDDAEVRLSAARALRILTNHHMVSRRQLVDDDSREEVVERWRQWYDENGDLPREEWLTCGFRDAGYEVENLSVDHVWDLCRAVDDDDHLSYNAQRVLMQLSGRTPASLSWSKEDANFFWRRWFERRWRSFGAPPIPEELSTLD